MAKFPIFPPLLKLEIKLEEKKEKTLKSKSTMHSYLPLYVISRQDAHTARYDNTGNILMYTSIITSSLTKRNSDSFFGENASCMQLLSLFQGMTRHMFFLVLNGEEKD